MPSIASPPRITADGIEAKNLGEGGRIDRLDVLPGVCRRVGEFPG
ncbi:hypothetical protein [Tautonia sociabilis]|nr:hypothetical protein [Tautonia sociabilis]